MLKSLFVILGLCLIVIITVIFLSSASENIVEEKRSIDTSTWPQKDRVFHDHRQRKYIPIKGTNALFAETETTVSDWTRFLQATQYDWHGSIEFNHSDTSGELPVTHISWHDANAYCQWLTKMERHAGLISPDMEYRLPTDEEWSKAAGLENEKVEPSFVKRFKKRSFRGMERPIPHWLEKVTPEPPQWNPSDLSGLHEDTFPWGKEWPPDKNDTTAYPDRPYQAYSRYKRYQQVLNKPLAEVHWGADSSDLIELYRSNFGQDWATDLTTFGPLALTRIVWIYKQGIARLVYQDGFTYCLVEPPMRVRQAGLIEQWLGAELAEFDEPESMQTFAKNYPHGNWNSGVAIGGRYQMENEYDIPEWQEWQGFYSDPQSSRGKWIWSRTKREISTEWWRSDIVPKPSYLFETALLLKKNGLLEPINRHSNLPLLLRWKGKKTAKEIQLLCEEAYKKQTKAILAEYEDTMERFVRPTRLSTSKKNASILKVQDSALSASMLRGLSGNVSEWVADSMTNPNDGKPIIAWIRGASWKLSGGHRGELLSSHRKSDFCTERTEFTGFRPVLGLSTRLAPRYEPDQWGEHYYAIITVAQDWETAAALCRKSNGYLLSLEKKDEAEWVKKRFVDYGNIQLGASRIVGEDSRVQRAGSWTWESGNPFTYFPRRIPHNFSSTEPILRMALDRDGWHDDKGKNKAHYIIEWESPATP